LITVSARIERNAWLETQRMLLHIHEIVCAFQRWHPGAK
jgi:hypothetical protein